MLLINTIIHSYVIDIDIIYLLEYEDHITYFPEG